MSKQQITLSNSITKIWIVILILAGSFAALIYWGAKSYKESAASVQRIVKPDNKAVLTNDIFQSVIQSDLHLNNFILTNDSLQKNLSQRYSQQTDSLILELEERIEDVPWQKLQLDSLKGIIEEKSKINTVLIDLKKRQNSQFFTEQALNRIKTQLSDSAYIDKSITQKQDLIIRRDTVEWIDIVKNPDKYKGISGFFRKIFGKEKIEIDTITSLEEQLNYGLALSVNSEIVRDYFIDTTLMVVKSILIDVLDEEIQLQRKLYFTEMEIITYNELLLQNIRELLEAISKSNKDILKSEQEQAIHKIEKAHKAAFIIAGAGILLGFVLLFFLIKDITQTNVYRNKLEKEKDRAEQLAAAKEVFLSRMSHEIRTPLHSISGFSSLLEKEITDKKQRKLLNGISYANHYLNELIENILEQAKINAGTYRLESSKIYIPELCSELQVLFKHRQEEKGNTFKTEYSDNLKNYQVSIDRIKLKQVLVNLLGNAIKFTRQGSIFLQFNLSEKSGQYTLQIKVADTGVGIDPKLHTSIFLPFNQTLGNQEINATGTGLGLSISKHIVESFGGSITVESALGKGSIFTINLPVKCEAYTGSTDVIQEIKQQENSYYPINVLAVEDDEWNAYLLQNYLSEHVAELKLCQNAEDGLAVLNQNPAHYNLILTDLNLPKMDGKSFFKSIAPSLSVPVIAFSASLSKKDQKDLIQLGFADAIGKPFAKEDLFMAIERLFQKDLQTNGHKVQADNFQINLAGISDFLAGSDTAQTNEQYALFISSFEAKTQTFKEAVQTNNIQELARMAHQLKSNCEQIGINSLSERLQSIEVFAEIGNTQRALEEAKALLPQLEGVLRELQLYLTAIS